MNIAPMIAASLGIFLARAVIQPVIDRYLAWKNSPRTSVARRNWRGIYVPDLGIIRGERAVWVTIITLIVLGAAIGWTISVGHVFRARLTALDACAAIKLIV